MGGEVGGMSGDVDRYESLHAIVREARRLGGAARTELLDERCGDDASLRREVEELLSLMESDAVDAFSETQIEVARDALEDLVSGEDVDAPKFG